MSVIDKMSIVGIRSFGPEDHNRQVIEFFKPLTLILGPNGTGKTTIIECLRYMTTGDPPPNSDRGGSFVHDPKLVGEQEVKGQVKLQFKDVMGKKVVVTRSLMVTQSVKKLTLKTLEGNITRYSANGEKTQLTTRCAEIDSEMISSLGVSKAILNNVIFCHQEESNWPLSEGKSLKQKFDEIFAATRYIKALEEIRKIRLAKMADIKLYQSEEASLLNNKRKAEEYKKELNETEARMAMMKDTLKEFDSKLQPLLKKIRELQVKQTEFGQLQASLDSNLDIIKKYEKDEADLRNSIKNVFSGSKDELETEMQNFTAMVSQKKENLKRVQQNVAKLERDMKSDLKTKARLLEELGKLKAEHDSHKKCIAQRDAKLRALRQKLGLGDLMIDEDEMMDEAQVDNVLRNLKQRNIATQNELSNCKVLHEAKINEILDSIDKKNVEKAQKQQKLSSSNEQIAKNKRASREIHDELSRLDSLASRQDDIEEELREAEEELNKLDGRVNVDECKEKLALKEKQKAEIETKLSLLSQEMNQLLKESKTRHEIDSATKDISSKREAIDKVLNRHRETILHLLQEVPESDIYEKVNQLSNNLSNKIHAVNKDIEKERSNLSSLETTKKFHERELESKEKLLSEYRSKISDMCGSQDFDYGCESLKNAIQELQDAKGALTGSLYLYETYIKKLSRPHPDCPLCKRSFERVEDAKALVGKLQDKLRNVPASLDQKNRLLAEKESMFGRMVELRPVRETVLSLSGKEIPELKKKLEEVSAKIAEANSNLSQLEETLDDLSSDKKAASNIIPDLIDLDRNQRELERLNRKMSNLKSLIGGKDVSRTTQQVSDEQTALQKEMTSLNQEIQSIQQEMYDYREKMQQLRGRVNDLNATKIKMCSDLQKKSSFLEQLESISKENAQLQDVVKEGKLELNNLSATLETLGKEKVNAIKLKEKEMEAIHQKIREEEKEAEAIEALNQEITRYSRENKEEKLVLHEDKLKDITLAIESKTDEKNRFTEQEKEFNKDINSQELLYRDLEDNMKLIKIMEKITELGVKSQKLKAQIGGYNIRSLLAELDKLSREHNDLIKQKAEMSGRENETKETIRRLKRELDDDMFKDAEKKHLHKQIELRTTEVVCKDLSTYYQALSKAIMNYHKMKMNEINKIIKDLWRSTYAGHDIDYIEIQSDEDEGSLEKAKRQYNYRVVMYKGDTSTDMRGRCSAGQKVLASLVIRLALAETFCLNCGILALDEPTTNLDNENIANLACALVEIVKSRSEQRNFQLIIITHDAAFIERLGRSETVDHFYKVSKDANAFSKVSKCYISDMT